MMVSRQAVGPGKVHIHGWPEIVEKQGLIKTPGSDFERRFRLQQPKTSIRYIAAIMASIANEAEVNGWDIRNNPEILGQIYHGWDYARWKSAIASKPKGSSFGLVPGTMGPWILDNKAYLENAVGVPERQ